MSGKRIILTADAPAGIQRLAGKTERVVEYTNPDGGKVYWFVMDGRETKLPPVHVGR
jgi:hypothetical protein